MAHLLRDRLGLGFVRGDKEKRVTGGVAAASGHGAVPKTLEVSFQLCGLSRTCFAKRQKGGRGGEEKEEGRWWYITHQKCCELTRSQA